MENMGCLVVDDSPIVRKIARKMLEKLGFDVSEVEDGQEAVECCSISMPGTILLDWNMPIMSGIEFLRRLRAMKGGDLPLVVFCTTEGDVDHIREGLSAGADEYLIKPFDSTTLRSKLGKRLADPTAIL